MCCPADAERRVVAFSLTSNFFLIVILPLDGASGEVLHRIFQRVVGSLTYHTDHTGPHDQGS